MDAWESLKARMVELDAIGGAVALLEWDQQTHLPPGGSEARGAQSAVLGRIHHERFTDPAVGDWLARLREEDLDPVRFAAVRNASRRYDRAVRVPSHLVEALAHARTAGFAAWMQAREANDFRPFAEPLQRLVALTREQAAHQGNPGEAPYEVLLGEYDPGTSLTELRSLLTRLGQQLEGFLAELDGRPHPAGFSGALDVAGQRTLSERLLTDLGFDRTRGRLDLSEHPFSVGIASPDDVRITTRFHDDNFLAALGGTVHEAGHALYEQGLPKRHAGTGLDKAASMGLHESQSRFWENFIGRSEAFCRYLAPRMHGIWPTLRVTPRELYGAMNRVERSLIRILADEATYNLHILVRFELELALIDGSLAVQDLPEAWNEGYRTFLRLDPPDPRRGVLQDVHWSGGAFGYFPSYTVGNLYAASFGAKIQEDLPDIWARVERGDFSPILDWLRRNVHSKGHLEDAPALVRGVVGDRDPVADLMAHLRSRQGALYGAS